MSTKNKGYAYVYVSGNGEVEYLVVQTSEWGR